MRPRHRLPPLFSLPPGGEKKTSNQSDQYRRRRRTAPEMAADRTSAALEDHEDLSSSDLNFSPEDGCHIPKRHARVTVKYNRKELQKRLDLEKWIDESLDELYAGQVGPTVQYSQCQRRIFDFIGRNWSR